jgi:hypothetical protein
VTDSWTYTAPVVASWARARSRGKARFTDPRHKAALECHRLHALAARPRGWLTDGVYRVSICYRPADARRRDADRVLSLVLDALVGVAWDDDSDRYIAGAWVTRFSEALYGQLDATPPVGSTLVRVTRIAGIAGPPEPVKRKRGKA